MKNSAIKQAITVFSPGILLGLILFIFLVGMISIPAEAQSPVTGLDIAVIINDGYRQLRSDEISGATSSVYQSVRTLAQYLGDRNMLVSRDERHTLSVIRFERDETPNVILSQQNLPLTLADELRPPVQAGCTGCAGDFLNPFQVAVQQLDSVERSDARRRVIILFTDDVYGPSAASSADEFTRMTNQLEAAINDEYDDLYVYGLRGRNLSEVNWNGSLGGWQRAGIEITTERFTDPVSIQLDLINNIRALLPAIGDVVQPNQTLTIAPYQASFSVFFFREQPGQSISLSYQGDLPDNSLEREVRQGNETSLIQVITVENPRAGDWLVQVSGGTPASKAIESTAQAAVIRPVIEAPDEVIYPNQALRIVWKAEGRNDQIINYGEALLDITAEISVGDSTYTRELSYEVGTGEYRADFYASESGQHTITFDVTGARLPVTTPEVTFDVAAFELVANTPTAEQFRNWQFTAFFAPTNQSTVLVDVFAVLPTLNATIIWPNGITQNVNLERDASTGIYTSAPLNIAYNANFDLTLSATITGAGDQQVVQLPTRAEGGRQAVQVSADPGTATFTNIQPRLLDIVEIRYSPNRLNAASLEEGYQPRVTAWIADTESADTWQIPMSLSSDETYYQAEFYASRDVAHSLTIRAQTANLPFIDLTSTESLNPTPITVRFLPNNLQPLQTMPYTFDFELEQNNTTLATPFTSGVAINARLTIEAENTNANVTYPDIPLSASETTIGRFSGTIERFLAAGSHRLVPMFDVLENPSEGRQARLIRLPVSNEDSLVLDVQETLYLIPNIRIEDNAVSEANLFSTTIVPFSERLPLVFDVELEAIPKSIADDSSISLEQQTGQRVSPPSAFRDGTVADWYVVEVKLGEQVVDPGTYTVQAPVPNGDLYRYEILGLPDATYIVTVRLNNQLQLEGQYGFQESRLEDSVSIAYGTNPLQTAVTGGGAVVLLALIGFIIVRVRTANRAAVPSGYLYLQDPAGRTFWAYDMGTNLKTNTGTIGGGQGFERALISSIDVISNPQLLREGKLRVRVVIDKTPQPEITMLADHDPVPIGDGRFKLGRSSQPAALHNSEKELERIKPNGT